MTKTNKTNTPAKKTLRFEITDLANSTTEKSAKVIATVMAELAGIGKSTDEKLESLALKQLEAVYMGKGQAEGCASVFKALFESQDYNIKRFAPMIKSFVYACGMRFSTGGLVPKALNLPDGVPEKPTAEGWEAYKAWIEANVVFNPKADETAEEKAKKETDRKEKEAKKWNGKAGHDQAILELLKLQKRIKPLNKKQASLIRLIACNYDAIESVLAEMSADKRLSRKIPDGIEFKE